MAVSVAHDRPDWTAIRGDVDGCSKPRAFDLDRLGPDEAHALRRIRDEEAIVLVAGCCAGRLGHARRLRAAACCWADHASRTHRQTVL